MKNQKSKKRKKKQTILLRNELNNQLSTARAEHKISLGMLIVMMTVLTLIIFIAKEVIIKNLFVGYLYITVISMTLLVFGAIFLLTTSKKRQEKIKELIK